MHHKFTPIYNDVKNNCKFIYSLPHSATLQSSYNESLLAEGAISSVELQMSLDRIVGKNKKQRIKLEIE